MCRATFNRYGIIQPILVEDHRLILSTKYSKICLKRPLKKIKNWVLRPIIAKCRSKVLQNTPKEHSAILLTFIKLPFVFKTFVLSIFERPLKIGFTVSMFLALQFLRSNF